MKKAVVLASVALVAMTFAAGPAAAFESIPHYRHHHHHHIKKIKVPQDGSASGGKSGPSPLASYLLVSTFCAAGSLIVQSAYVGEIEHRELTSREAFYTTGNCFVPFVGGPLFWALANGGNPD
jgi:hypothetical protein